MEQKKQILLTIAQRKRVRPSLILQLSCFILVSLSLPRHCTSFSIPPVFGTTASSIDNNHNFHLNAEALDQQNYQHGHGSPLMMRHKNSHSEESSENISTSRRNALNAMKSSFFLLAGASLSSITNPIQTASAADSYVQDTIYLTGKAPKVPGQKPKDKSDTSGTKKDPKFLRSVADCKVSLLNKIYISHSNITDLSK